MDYPELAIAAVARTIYDGRVRKFDEAANSFYEGVTLDPENKALVDAFREAVEAGRKFHGTDQQKS
ncbi:hypothetical protein ACSBR1_018268 [Camellia fascicularis]